MGNHDLKFIYEQLKDKYDLVLTNAFALDAGFDTDINVLCGESNLGKFYLYKDVDDWDEYVFSVDLFNEKYTHWHPTSTKQALEDVVAFMDGTADWL